MLPSKWKALAASRVSFAFFPNSGTTLLAVSACFTGAGGRGRVFAAPPSSSGM
jgi:hypothetical protein